MGDRLEPIEPDAGDTGLGGSASDDPQRADDGDQWRAQSARPDDGQPQPAREGVEPTSQAAPVPPGWSPNQPPPAWTPAWTSTTPGWTPPEPAASGSPPPAWDDHPTAGATQGWGQSITRRPDVKPGVIPLRPLGVGEILDGAISTIRDHPRVVLGISAIVAVGSAVLSGVVSWIALRDLESVDPATATDEEILDALWTSLAAAGGAGLVITLANVMATGVLTMAIGRAVLGQRLTLQQAWESARPRLLRLLGLWVLTMIAVGAAVLAPLIPGIALSIAGVGGAGALLGIGVLGSIIAGPYTYVRLALAPPALMLEKQRIIMAMRRSARLVKRSWWRVFWILLLAFILTVILGQVIQAPFSAISEGSIPYLDSPEFSAPSIADIAIVSVGSIIAGTITLPFSAGVTTLLYIDRRIRREGLDIELARAARSGGGSPDAASGNDR